MSAGFQDALKRFPSALDPAFLPDAYAKFDITGGTQLPQTAVIGQSVSVTGTVTNVLPGAAAAASMPVRLQSSTDGGTTWANAGAAVDTGADGALTVSTTITETAAYRLAFPQFAVTAYNALTASVTPLGIVTAIAAADATKPKVSRVRLTRTRVSLASSEAARITVTIVRRNARRKLKTLTITEGRKGSNSRRMEALEAGTYRVTVRATDAAGNVRTVKTTVAVKKSTTS